MDPVLTSVISELLINLSAAWMGAAVIVPTAVKVPKRRFFWLTLNLGLGILSLLTAFLLRKTALV